jgi:hypothetical protein
VLGRGTLWHLRKFLKYIILEFKHCVHMFVNGKIIPFETIPGMGGRRDKGEWWRG